MSDKVEELNKELDALVEYLDLEILRDKKGNVKIISTKKTNTANTGCGYE